MNGPESFPITDSENNENIENIENIENAKKVEELQNNDGASAEASKELPLDTPDNEPGTRGGRVPEIKVETRSSIDEANKEQLPIAEEGETEEDRIARYEGMQSY